MNIKGLKNKLQIAVLVVVLAIFLAQFSERLPWFDRTYSQDKAESQRAQQELARLEQASTAFRLVAKALRPSVVSIRTTKVMGTAAAPQLREPWSGREDPFQRRFFGDDFFERFFGTIPREGQQYKQSGIGTGVIVDAKGYILTNNHVVADADEIVVQISDKREFTISGDDLKNRVWTDDKSDLAVLKIDADDLAPARWGSSENLEVGDWVVAIGNPFGLELTVTAGICSAKGRALADLAEYQDFIQTDAAINPGNSGGPLVNLKGEVVGINTAIFSRSGGYMGIGFAIPSNMARSIMDRLIKDGKVTRGHLGVYIQEMTPELAKSFGLDKVQGVVVPKVLPDSPAEKAGIKQGDIIMKINGKAVKSAQQLKNTVATLPIGKKVDIVIRRGSETKTVSAEITERGAEGGKSSLADYGFEVQELTSDLAQRLGYQGQKGVVVSQVKSGSPADRAGLRQGDLIVSVQQRNVDSLEEFHEGLSTADPSRGLLLLVRNKYGVRYLALKNK